MEHDKTIEAGFDDYWNSIGKGLLRPPFNSMVVSDQMERIAKITWIECACFMTQREMDLTLEKLSKLKENGQ